MRPHNTLHKLAVLALLLLLPASPSPAERRTALVIGNAAYEKKMGLLLNRCMMPAIWLSPSDSSGSSHRAARCGDAGPRMVEGHDLSSSITAWFSPQWF